MARVRRGHAHLERSDLLSRHWSEEGRSLAAWLLGGTVVRVEEFTEPGAYVLRAELPGIDPDEDVEITTSAGVLSVHAVRREEKKEKVGGRYRTEFRYGALSRSVTLPSGAREDEIAATYKDGILDVRVPVETGEEETASRTINIRRG
jgi:HSP20 family protein